MARRKKNPRGITPMEALFALRDRDMDALILMDDGDVPSSSYDATHLYEMDLIMQPSNHARVTRLGNQVAQLARIERGPTPKRGKTAKRNPARLRALTKI